MKKQPNIVVFMTDQQLGDTLLPNHLAKTPNVDRLLKQGITFKEAFCPAPHCCPSRATFFTGLYPSQHNIWNNVEVDGAFSREFFDGVEAFPVSMQRAGYHTIFSGKWHVHGYEGPEEHGFEEVLFERQTNYGRMKRSNTPMSETWTNVYSGSEKMDNEQSKKEFGRIIRPGYPTYYQFGVDEKPFDDEKTVDVACEYIEGYKDEQPFFMYVGTTGPHDPYTPPQEFIDLYSLDDIELPDSFDDPMEDVPALYRRTREMFKLTREEHKESIRRYLAFCSYEDFLFGKLLDTLEQTGRMEDTVVLYVSDHGDYVGAHGLWAKGLPCYREAYQICAVMAGAGIEAKGTVSQELISLADFAPTFMELAGTSNNQALIGKSLVPFLHGVRPSDWRQEIYTQTNGNEIYGMQRAVWNKKWKLIHNAFDYDVLFDLENDPLEMHNVINDEKNKSIVRELWKKLWLFSRDTGDIMTCPYIMVGLAPYGPGIVLEEE